MHDKPHTKEARRKISEASKRMWTNPNFRKRFSEQRQGRPAHNKGIWHKRICPICKMTFEYPDYKNQKYCSRRCVGLSQQGKKPVRPNWKPSYGEKNGMWKGGTTDKNQIIRTTLKYKKWRKDVFERDNYTCQLCGARSGNGKAVCLEAHHLKRFSEFPEKRFDVDNGITLCKKCHAPTKGLRPKRAERFKDRENVDVVPTWMYRDDEKMMKMLRKPKWMGREW